MEQKMSLLGVTAVVGGGDAATQARIEEENVAVEAEEVEDGSGNDDMQLAPVPPTPTPLQQLVHACRVVFTDTTNPPTDDAIALVRGVMGNRFGISRMYGFIHKYLKTSSCGLYSDKIGMLDVGLMDEVGFFCNRSITGHQSPPILTWKIIYEGATFKVTIWTSLSKIRKKNMPCITKIYLVADACMFFPCSLLQIAVFYLPMGVAMPLHDHPDVTVISKLLVGSSHNEAYECVSPRVNAAGSGSALLAKKVIDQHVIAPSGASVKTRDCIHHFMAGQNGPCVFLNVFVPLNSPAEQRCSAFYKNVPYEFHPSKNQ
ncbi:hypothetical protein EJB05_05389 [Eragrostis curvula]|uniref:cysteine dioxygenase n=1 Tax=Eragrostis curvula TaxID=38414 RepID=A0A5J9WD11_9POAL|nr:hypothetical protein EJB05_05389 [Eragrostis curvula]